jgi:hypothetical protein
MGTSVAAGVGLTVGVGREVGVAEGAGTVGEGVSVAEGRGPVRLKSSTQPDALPEDKNTTPRRAERAWFGAVVEPVLTRVYSVKL